MQSLSCFARFFAKHSLAVLIVASVIGVIGVGFCEREGRED